MERTPAANKQQRLEGKEEKEKKEQEKHLLVWEPHWLGRQASRSGRHNGHATVLRSLTRSVIQHCAQRRAFCSFATAAPPPIFIIVRQILAMSHCPSATCCLASTGCYFGQKSVLLGGGAHQQSKTQRAESGANRACQRLLPHQHTHACHAESVATPIQRCAKT